MADTSLDQILSQLDNPKFYSDFGLRINKKSGKAMQCECPFCGDKKHFNLSPDMGLWQCFKCSESGNQITFLAKMQKCSNGQAVKMIKDYLGIVDEGKPKKAGAKGTKKKAAGKSSKAKTASSKTSTKATKKDVVPSSSPEEPSTKTKIYDRLIELTNLTEEHREEFHRKRGFNDQIIDLLKFRSGGEYLNDVLQQLEQEFAKEELIEAGLLIEKNGATFINNQLTEGRVLIPYLDETGQHCYHLRPHKLGFEEIPVQPYCSFLLKNQPEHVILTEGEFKAAALLQWGIPAIAIPGTSSFGGVNYDRLVEALKQADVKKVTVIFDSEDKSNPEYPNFKEKIEDRYDTQYWSYMMGYKLGKSGFLTRVGWLPEEWRDNGKIDFDGALAQGRTRAEIEKVIKEAKTSKEFLESLDEEAKRIVKRKITRNFAKHNIGRDFNKYVAKRWNNGKETEEIISNFVINIKSSFYTPSGVIRNVELVNEYGETSEVFPIEPGSMAGTNEFKKFLLSKGNYIWDGNAKDLNNLWRYEFSRDSGELIWMPERIGRITSDIWLFGNMAIKKGVVYKPDSDGICWINGRGYKPQAFTIGPQGEPIEDAIPSLSQRKIDIVDVADKMKHCIGGYEAYIMIGWVIATIFSQDIFERYKCMPILFPHGKRESGKTTAMRWVMSFFGIETEGISVGKTTTQNYIARVMSYYSSLGVWFDEYRNETGVIEKDGYFRSAYNRQLSGKGTATAFQAKGFNVYAALAISGEELPRDNGLFTRCVPVQISAYKRKRDYFDWLNQHCSEFSNLTYNLILNYDYYKEEILENIALLKKALVKRDITDRTAENWAICAGAFWAVVKQDAEFMKWVEQNCQEIKRSGEEEHMLNQFWDDVNYLVMEKDISAEFFRVEEDKMFVPFNYVFQKWELHYKRKTNREPFDIQSIRNYLYDEPYFLENKLEYFNVKGKQINRRGVWIDLKKATETIIEISKAVIIDY